ncbi:MAG: hypothetical protein M3357_07680 [Actinomycetota bacterium]|nr:hypothetical protein [Actinomycetota bacterium]
MPNPPPRLLPTVALAALWLALYLLYLSVKPDPPAQPERDQTATTTTTSVTSGGGGEEELSRPGVPARAPGWAR